MMELLGDITVICGPASLVHWAFHDAWVSGLWVVVGVTVQWYRRHWRQAPYSNGPDNDGDAV